MTTYVLPMELPRLEAALRDCGSRTAEARWVAALALSGEQGDGQERAVLALTGLLGDPVEEVRAQAVEGLASHLRAGFTVDRGPLLRVFDDPSDAVRCAVLASADLICDDWGPLAVRMLADRAPSVRASAARLLGETGVTDARDALRGLLEDPDGIVAREAALALAALGDSAGAGEIERMLSEDVSNAVIAANALGRLADPAGRPALERAAAGWFVDPELKAAAAAASVACGGSAGREVLVQMMSSFRAGTRMCAYRALSVRPLEGFVAPLAERLTAAGPPEASSIVRALVSLAAVERAAVLGLLRGGMEVKDLELAAEIEEAIREIEDDRD
jgi:hypothetical protein